MEALIVPNYTVMTMSWFRRKLLFGCRNSTSRFPNFEQTLASISALGPLWSTRSCFQSCSSCLAFSIVAHTVKIAFLNPCTISMERSTLDVRLTALVSKERKFFGIMFSMVCDDSSPPSGLHRQTSKVQMTPHMLLSWSGFGYHEEQRMIVIITWAHDGSDTNRYELIVYRRFSGKEESAPKLGDKNQDGSLEN